MSLESSLLITSLVFGFYAAWNIGANDVANAMGTSVGSKALTLRQAVILASIFEFLGAVLFGANVSETLEKGLVSSTVFSDNPLTYVYGMLASLLATGLWLQFASYCGLPVSTTHTIVGAIVGFGAVVGGIDAVNWNTVLQIALTWIASPLLGACASYLLFVLIKQHIFYTLSPLAETKKLLPYIAASVVFVLALSMMSRVIAQEANTPLGMCIALGLAVLSGVSVHFYLRKIEVHAKNVRDKEVDPHLLQDIEKAKKHLERVQTVLQGEARFQMSDIVQELNSFTYSFAMTKKEGKEKEKTHTEFYWVERLFGYLQIMSACLMAFAHGSNDVSNAIGPIAGIFSTLQARTQHAEGFPLWALILGGAGIIIGLATWGWRVIETIGKRITELTPSRGFSAEFGAALTILLASKFGFPISTTHTLVGSVFGVGLAGGLASLNARTLRDIIVSWMVTIPAGAILSIICYYVIEAVFH